MARYVIVDLSTDKVINAIDDDGTFDPGTGFVSVRSDVAENDWNYDELTGILTAPPPTPQQQLSTIYAASVSVPYLFNGHYYSILSSANLTTDTLAATYQDPSDSLQVRDISGTYVTITRGDLLTLYSAIYNKMQQVSYANITVQAAINAHTLTDYTLVDDAFITAMAAATIGTKLTTLAELIDIVNELTYDDIADGSENKGFTSTEKTKLDALPDADTLASSLAGKATPTDITTAINALVNSAPGVLDTLGEIAAALQADESAAAALAALVAGKVDKITGKGLSTNDFTTTLLTKLNALSTARTTSSQTLSLVGTGNTGTQISASKDSKVSVSVSLSATSVLLTAATSGVTLKKCATNSTTEADWSTAFSAQALIGSSGVALTQTDIRTLSIDVPAGWFVKAESVGTGTHAETLLAAEKTIYG